MNPENPSIADWTVMIYFAADNDLEDAALANLAQIKKAGSSDRVKILAQLDTRTSGQTFRYCLGDDRTLLEEDVIETLPEINTGDPAQLTEFIEWAVQKGPAQHYMLVLWGHGTGWEDVEDANRAAQLSTNPVFKPDANSARSYSLSPNGQWRIFGAGEQPITTLVQAEEAAETFKQLACQASVDLTAAATPQGAGLLLDVALSEAGGRSQDALKLRELGCALATALGINPFDDCPKPTATSEQKPIQKLGRKIDVLGMDTCLMGSAEVASQIAPYVNYMVASEDVIPRDSWPYDRILARLHTHSKKEPMKPEELAIWIAREYLIYYRNQNKDVTQAVFNLSDVATQRFHESLTALAKHLCDELVHGAEHPEIRRQEVMLARIMAQTFYLRSHVDLYDFCQHLKTYTRDKKLSELCELVMDSIFRFKPSTNAQGQEELLPCDDTLVFEYGSCGYRMRKSKGVSIYFPPVAPSEAYAESSFNQATQWFGFLSNFARPFKEQVAAVAKAKSDKSLTQSRPGAILGFKVREGTTDKVRDGTTDKIPGPPNLTLPKLRKGYGAATTDSSNAAQGPDQTTNGYPGNTK